MNSMCSPSDSPILQCAGTTWRTCSNRSPDFTPRVCDSVGLEWSLRVCISNKCPGGADVAGPGTTLRTTSLKDGCGQVIQKASRSQLPNLLTLCTDQVTLHGAPVPPLHLPLDEAETNSDLQAEPSLCSCIT